MVNLGYYDSILELLEFIMSQGEPIFGLCK